MTVWYAIYCSPWWICVCVTQLMNQSSVTIKMTENICDSATKNCGRHGHRYIHIVITSISVAMARHSTPDAEQSPAICTVSVLCRNFRIFFVPFHPNWCSNGQADTTQPPNMNLARAALRNTNYEFVPAPFDVIRSLRIFGRLLCLSYIRSACVPLDSPPPFYWSSDYPSPFNGFTRLMWKWERYPT